MRSRRITLVLAALPVAVALTACGSSGHSGTTTTVSTIASASSVLQSLDTPATSQTLVSGFDRVCSAYATAVGGVAQPRFTPAAATNAQLPSLATYLSRVLPINETEEHDLSAEVSDVARPALVTAVADLSTAITFEGVALKDAEERQDAAFKAAYGSAVMDLDSFKAQARAAGVTDCSRTWRT